MYDYENGDVQYDAYLTLDEAVHGTHRAYAFHTPAGHPYSVSVALPCGVRTNDYVVIAGQGGPAKQGSHRGDLWIKIHIVADYLIGADQHHTVSLALMAAATRHFQPI
jgi:DnaJ-class molecular chaperone